MAKDGKTEKATPQRRKEQRNKGNVFKSQDTSNFLSLTTLGVVVFVYAKPMISGMSHMVDTLFGLISQGAGPKALFAQGVKETAVIMAPIIMIGTVFQVLNYVLQTKFLFSMKILKPDFKRMNPINYFKNLFTRKKIIDLTKYFVLLIVLGFIAYKVLSGKVNFMISLIWSPWIESVNETYGVFKTSLFYILLFLLVMAAGDYVYQKWEYGNGIKMKKDEVKDERKKSDGNPEIKGRQREFMREILRNNIVQSMKEGTVVINNPTHISVALRYNKEKDSAPVVIAKGEEEMALYIRSLAKEYKIPMVENKPLARSIYYNTEVGGEIDEEMYEAVVMIMRHLVETKQLEL